MFYSQIVDSPMFPYTKAGVYIGYENCKNGFQKKHHVPAFVSGNLGELTIWE